MFISNAIKEVRARKIIDTRVEDTLEVDVTTEGGGFGRSAAGKAAPASRGIWEPPYFPKEGVDSAIMKVRTQISPKLIGMDATRQESVDRLLREIDGTPNFSDIGGNTATAVSISVAKAAASTLRIPFYNYVGTPFSSELSIPIANTIGGGPHARKGKSPDMQEHHVIPVGAKSMREAVLAIVAAYRKARQVCDKTDPGFTGGADDESAWVPSISDRKALEILTDICKETEDETGVKMRLGIDVAASSLWNSKKEVYVYEQEKAERNSSEQFEFVSKLIETFPFYYVEDAFHEDDYHSFNALTKKYGSTCLVCGDDLFSTNIKRLEKGMSAGAANSLIVKINMVGTLTDAYKTVDLAHKHGYVPIKSCRSGETEDTAIAHLAVAWGCPFNKFGIAGRGAAKLNELIRIEEELGSQARMPRLRIAP